MTRYLEMRLDEGQLRKLEQFTWEKGKLNSHLQIVEDHLEFFFGSFACFSFPFFLNLFLFLSKLYAVA